MKINKRLVGGLLGGGVTTLVASLGGVKLNDTLSYNKKVAYYEGIRKFFDNVPVQALKKGWYFPKWEDEATWKEQFERDTEGIKKHHKTAKEFRDWCYEKLKEEANKDWSNCNESSGWCMDCVRGENW